jgi:hypothetical protein
MTDRGDAHAYPPRGLNREDERYSMVRVIDPHVLLRQIATSSDAEWGRQLAREHLGLSTSRDRNTLVCSFCGHAQHEVGVLFIGHRVGICDACVEAAAAVLVERQEAALEEIRRLGT